MFQLSPPLLRQKGANGVTMTRGTHEKLAGWLGTISDRKVVDRDHPGGDKDVRAHSVLLKGLGGSGGGSGGSMRP